MTEEEYDLKNTKLAKVKKYAFLLSIVVFVLTSYYVGLFIPVSAFIFGVFITFAFGLVYAALLIGSQILAKTNLQMIFSLSAGLIGGTFLIAVSSYLGDEIPRENRYLGKTIISINCISLVFLIGTGALLAFRSEIERITKLVQFSAPRKKRVLNIEGSEINQN